MAFIVIITDFSDTNIYRQVPEMLYKIMKCVQLKQSCFFRKEGRTDRHDEANSHFCNFVKAPKSTPKKQLYTVFILNGSFEP